MPIYGVPQSGGVLTSLNPGDIFSLWNNESPTAPNLSSVAFARGVGEGLQPSGMVFQLIGGAAANVAIQGSNQDINGDYITLSTLSSAAPYYQDSGNFAFYRAQLTSGTGPLSVIVQR